MPELNPLSNEQIFLKKIAENTGSDYNTGDVSEINPLTIDQILLKEIAANTAGQSGDITELEEKVTANTSAIEAITEVYGAKNLVKPDLESQESKGVTVTRQSDGSYALSGTATGSVQLFYSSYLYGRTGKFIISGGANFGIKYDGKYADGSYEHVINVATGIQEIYITVGSGQTVNTTVYPMLRDARIKDPTYVPYAMTNRELTERVEKIKTGVYNGSLNDLTYTFIGFGYNVTDAATGDYGFIINIAEKIEGSIKINQQWCQNDQTTWHTRNSSDGGVSWSTWS